MTSPIAAELAPMDILKDRQVVKSLVVAAAKTKSAGAKRQRFLFFLIFGCAIVKIIRFTKVQDAEFKRNYVTCSPDRLGCGRHPDEVLPRAAKLRNYV